MARPPNLEPTIRKSIALPVRLWDAISKIRRDTSGRIPSEVETVRALLWEAVSARQNIAEESRRAYREGRREAIEQCIDHLRVNGIEAAEKCLGERFRRELYGMHDG